MFPLLLFSDGSSFVKLHGRVVELVSKQFALKLYNVTIILLGASVSCLFNVMKMFQKKGN